MFNISLLSNTDTFPQKLFRRSAHVVNRTRNNRPVRGHLKSNYLSLLARVTWHSGTIVAFCLMKFLNHMVLVASKRQNIANYIAFKLTLIIIKPILSHSPIHSLGECNFLWQTWRIHYVFGNLYGYQMTSKILHAMPIHCTLVASLLWKNGSSQR